MAAAVALYGGIGAILIGATATARHVVEEDLVQVEFVKAAEPPPPEPEPEPAVEPEPEPKKNYRKKVDRKKIKPPDKISDEKLKESDGPLAAAGKTGPMDGYLDGVKGGTGTARGTPKVKVTPPKMSKRNKKPRFPPKARRANVEGRVTFAFVVLPDGKTADVRIISGPRQFHETVIATVKRWRFTPAMRAGKPVRFKKKMSITFRLDDPY
ncbi:MAG: energy transducer TonB [Myxococcales bacterium]|nr:energy transducer TonB [Myxococcales bacterium]